VNYSYLLRLQAIAPHVQLSGPVRSTDAIVLDVHNAGAAPAVDLSVSAWILKSVGGTRSPEPAAVFIGLWHSLPPSAAPMQLKLIPTVDDPVFSSWKDDLGRAGVAPDALDVHLLLVRVTYRAVDGTEMSECMVLPLTEQKALPGTPTT
jgi:hypothetical protein